ncbi:MAG TPA: hypothetical protein VL201_01285 [Patescibacteria group bacterium]|nr:hypothetical protein [Patescibacteria group bacterium]
MSKKIIAIIGSGMVGATAAHSLLFLDMPIEIILVDTNEIWCKGQVLDLEDAATFVQQTCPRMGTMKDAEQADIIIIAAGAKQLVGQSRSALFAINAVVIKQICAQLASLRSDALILVITNPVDALTTIAQRELRLPPEQVFSSGTLLDTNRLKKDISGKIGVCTDNIQLYVLGEHGDTQFVCYSYAQVGEIPLFDYPDISLEWLENAACSAKNTAYTIIECKGATYYGIAACIGFICKAIIYNKKLLIPLSVLDPEEKIYYSMPVVLGERGIEKQVALSLSQQEKNLLQKSIIAIKKLTETPCDIR